MQGPAGQHVRHSACFFTVLIHRWCLWVDAVLRRRNVGGLGGWSFLSGPVRSKPLIPTASCRPDFIRPAAERSTPDPHVTSSSSFMTETGPGKVEGRLPSIGQWGGNICLSLGGGVSWARSNAVGKLNVCNFCVQRQ